HPRVPDHPACERRGSRRGGPAMTAPSTARILVVDDEPICRHGLVDLLRLRGIKADAAADGNEALRLFRRGEHRLIISDLAMPGLDGLGLMRTVKRGMPSTRF